jgi:hypothetical protein
MNSPDEQYPRRVRVNWYQAPPRLQRFAPCSFRWFIVAEGTVRWFVTREKHCYLAKRTGCWPVFLWWEGDAHLLVDSERARTFSLTGYGRAAHARCLSGGLSSVPPGQQDCNCLAERDTLLLVTSPLTSAPSAPPLANARDGTWKPVTGAERERCTQVTVAATCLSCEACPFLEERLHSTPHGSTLRYSTAPRGPRTGPTARPRSCYLTYLICPASSVPLLFPPVPSSSFLVIHFSMEGKANSNTAIDGD